MKEHSSEDFDRGRMLYSTAGIMNDVAVCCDS